MAKVATQTIAINVSKLIKNTEDTPDMVSATLVAQLEELVSELIAGDVIVEALIVE